MDSGDPLTGPSGQGRNIVQLLALFLLLLSFFILLNSLSSFETKRARSVIGSLNGTFAGRETANPAGPFIETGNRTAVERFQSALRAALLTAVPAARLARSEDGRQIEAHFAMSELFSGGEAALRPDRERLLRGIAAALRDRPADLRFDVELLLGSGADGTAPNAAGEALTRARAGVFARALVARGAPKDAIAVGIGGGAPGEVLLRFRVRDAGEGRLDFTPVMRSGRAVP
jgi:outer membrane protein OmpA-like peptidoglycan-associated protein